MYAIYSFFDNFEAGIFPQKPAQDFSHLYAIVDHQYLSAVNHRDELSQAGPIDCPRTAAMLWMVNSL